MKISPEQKKQLVSIFLTLAVSLVVAVAAVFGYDVNVAQPRAGGGMEPGASGGVGVMALPLARARDGLRVGAGSTRIDLEAGGQAKFADGTAAAPSLTFHADDDSGLYRIGANSVGLSGALTLSGGLTLTPSPSITVTNGAAFAPVGLQPIAAAGAVTPTITIPAAGTLVCIYNTSAQNVLIQDTGNQVLGGDRTLAQYDVLCGLSDGTRFIEIALGNN